MGKVLAVCISEKKGTQKKNIQEASFIEDFGIEKDAHAGKWHRQVSLLSYEKIEDFRNRGAEVADGAFGENLVVSGFDFKNLPIGTRFRCNDVVLELKLLADVGLVGFPNVGKSTLLSVVSKAHPKIANYHFTTLYPNLGVVYVDEGVSFVMADIPGIIEGAAEGAGLGHDFLRHIDRCRLLIHVVDVSGSEGRDPVADFEAIQAELKEYGSGLENRPMLVAGNKVDIAADRSALEALRTHVEGLGLPFYEISAAAQQGTRELMYAAARELEHLPPITVYEPTYVERPPEVDMSEPLEITHEDDTWLVEGPWLQRLMANVNFGDYESRNWFDRMLRQSGLFDRLEEMGIQDGDIVSLYNLEFEYQR
mgnify:CR=1 FL=1